MSHLSNFWKLVYKVYPPFLRILEGLNLHKGRQPYILGVIKHTFSKEELKLYLKSQGYEHVYLAWKDTGEMVSMRKIDKEVFQYHIRLFADGEIRGHYEYSPEGNPLRHVFRGCFEKGEEYFNELLKDYIC